MGTILLIDVENEKISREKNGTGEYGRGLAVRLLEEYDTAPMLVIAPGLFTGAPVPCATRASIAQRESENSGFFVSNISGDLPQKMASMDLDGIVIKGRNRKGNLVLYMEEDCVEFVFCPTLQGLGCGQVVKELRDRWGKECAVIGCGPAADFYYPTSSLFVTYPYGKPEFTCPRSSRGTCLARMGIRAVVVRNSQYFQASCYDGDSIRQNGKLLAQYILKDPICGGALPGLGSITLLHLLKNREDLEAALQQIPKEKPKREKEPGERVNYCCAPMCVIGCLNRHSGSSGKIYSCPEESEIRAAVESSFGEYLTPAETESCTAYLSQKGMELGLNMIELIFAMNLYFEAVNERPEEDRICELICEIEKGTAVGRILGGGTSRVCRIYSDRESIQGKETRPAVLQEKDFRLELDKRIGKQSEKISDLELLYREIFLFENLGICIFSSFALINKEGPMELLAALYRDKTGETVSVSDMLEYSARALEREERFREKMSRVKEVKMIPEFVKVLYRYFEASNR